MNERANRIAGVLDMHQLDAPYGGTGSRAVCQCSCGFRAVVHGGLRAWAKADAQLHVAEQIIGVMKDGDGA